jgi:acyl-CoA synthetase (NDP forming)
MVRRIGSYLPPFWSRRNPVDLVGTRDPDVPLVAVEELLKWDGVDAVISLGIVGRHELAQLLLQSMQEVDPSATPDFLAQMGSLAREYERSYIERIAELMEMYEKPVIGVTLTRTREGTVRRVEGRRYSPLFFQTPEDAVNVLARMAAYRNSIEPRTRSSAC